MNSLTCVVGLGKTGLSIARYLQRKNRPFIAYDTRLSTPYLDEFKKEFPEVPVYLQDFPSQLVDQFTDLIVSPGISLELPFLKQASGRIYGDIECLAREITAPVIAITGTNGKSTVTTLIGEMAKAAGFQVAVAGNIGECVLDSLDKGIAYDLWVLELSSFQLELTHSLKPRFATILNISNDHLDRHHTLEAYIWAKQRIYHQADFALYNREDQATKPREVLESISFGQDEPEFGHWGLLENKGLFLAKGKTPILSVDALRMKGVHNWMNALAACAAAEAVGIPETCMIEVLKRFEGLSHRCQWVRTLEGVHWINDSKGTNIGAALSAIKGIGGSIEGKIVLIAGGQGKGADFRELSSAVHEFVRQLILFGEDADKIEAALQAEVSISRVPTLASAVLLAKTSAKPGDVVLLSPACASLDMFRDFNHRGEVFMELVNAL